MKITHVFNVSCPLATISFGMSAIASADDKPIKSLTLEKFGGGELTPYPGGGAQVTRGFVQVKESGIYEFRPGYGGSIDNIMDVGLAMGKAMVELLKGK